MMCSKILQQTQVREIGRYFSAMVTVKNTVRVRVSSTVSSRDRVRVRVRVQGSSSEAIT